MNLVRRLVAEFPALQQSETDWNGVSRCENEYTIKQLYKRIVLDSDIDPKWIKSLHTMMYDYKVLTLMSNECIPLSAAMQLLFQVSHLKNATPATVSRQLCNKSNQATVPHALRSSYSFADHRWRSWHRQHGHSQPALEELSVVYICVKGFKCRLEPI